MSLILATYSEGTSLESRQFTTVDDLLVQIPDNTAGAIQAADIRDSVFTLWQRIESVSASASSVGSVSVDYIRSAASSNTSAVGGVAPGSTFSGTVQDALDRIFYPYVSPGASLSGWSTKEFGDPSGYSFNLTWSVTVNSKPLTSIVVTGVSKPLFPLSGVQLVTSTHSSLNPPSSTGVSQVYNMTVSDGTSTTSRSHTVSWRNRIYWGKLNCTSIGNPDLSSNPGSASNVGSLVNSTVIRNLTGAGANGLAFGSELSLTKSKTYTGINGSGDYLIFAWPSNMASAYTPSFSVNGLPVSSFSRVKTNMSFTNQFGFSGSDYEVWVSNTQQNSPLNVVIT